VAAFGVVYGWTSLAFGWPLSLLAAWAAFVVATVLAQTVAWTPPAALAATLAAFALARRLLPAERGRAASLGPPMWDLPLRMAGTLAVVVTVTSVAERLGPALSGAFTPFPSRWRCCSSSRTGRRARRWRSGSCAASCPECGASRCSAWWWR
jgi:hypothetical protein